MKANRTVIAACVTTLFVSGTAFAKDSRNYHESEWNNVRSYGNVIIANDSVEHWGPWHDLAEPSAGFSTPLALLGAGKNEPYRTNPTTSAATVATGTDVCRAGDWCGYAVFVNYEYSNEKGDYSVTKPMSGLFGLTLTPDNPLLVTINGGSGRGSSSWRLASLTDTAALFKDSGNAVPTNFGNNWWYGSDSGLHNFYAYGGTSKTVGDKVYEDYSQAYGLPHSNNYYYWQLPTSNTEVAVGWIYRWVASYVRGDYYDEGSYTDSAKQVSGMYVAGIATPQSYLDAQRAGNVVATYSGNSYDWHGYQVSVNMTVNFGNASWTGSWNNGTDGYVGTATDSKGNVYSYGQVGFNAAGTINGANIQSTSLSARDGTVSGKVQGTFYGQTAGSIAGVSDIVKTKTGSTVAASNTALFLVNKNVAR